MINIKVKLFLIHSSNEKKNNVWRPRLTFNSNMEVPQLIIVLRDFEDSKNRWEHVRPPNPSLNKYRRTTDSLLTLPLQMYSFTRTKIILPLLRYMHR